jgi:hypothetical protein
MTLSSFEWIKMKLFYFFFSTTEEDEKKFDFIATFARFTFSHFFILCFTLTKCSRGKEKFKQKFSRIEFHAWFNVWVFLWFFPLPKKLIWNLRFFYTVLISKNNFSDENEKNKTIWIFKYKSEETFKNLNIKQNFL